jgi:hypothetical protein
MKLRGFKYYFIIFFCLSLILFFRPVIVPLSILYYIYYSVFLFVLLVVIVNYRNSFGNGFSAPLFLLLVAILISGLSATFSWGQGFLDSFKVLTGYLGYILFFLLLVWKINAKDIDSIIIILGCFYLVAFAIAFLSYPTAVFGDIENVSTDRGFERLRLDGRGFLLLFSFYSLGRFLANKNFWWLGIYFVTMVAVIMLLTRSIMIVSFIISVLFIIRNTSILKKFLGAILIGCLLYFITQMAFFNILVEQTLVQTENIEDDIRVESAYFYMNNFPPDNFARIFGNGEPSIGSNFSKVSYFLKDNMGLYQSDIGYLGLYSKFGILAILAYLVIIYRTYRISVPDEYLYCKYFLYFIFLISIIVDAPFNTSFIAAIAIALYILQIKYLSQADISARSA